MTIKLTVGMACYDGFPLVWATIQALRWMHQEVMMETEILVVDNHPEGPHGDGLKGMYEQWLIGSSTWGSDVARQMGKPYLEPNIGSVRVIPYTAATGTAAPRDLIFREAQGEYVVCIDAHVFIKSGALKRLIGYYDAHPGTRDLLSGPLRWDDLRRGPTHMRDQFRGGMWGTWDTDPRGAGPEGEPFEIPAMGLGLFSCRKDAWLGFNPNFRQFGGEEWYIHEKYRKAGAKCLCLPFLEWNHFFWEQGKSYPAQTYAKVRNMVIGHTELGRSLDRVHRHWVLGLNEQQEPGDPPMIKDSERITPEQWAVLVASPANPPETDPAVTSSTWEWAALRKNPPPVEPPVAVLAGPVGGHAPLAKLSGCCGGGSTQPAITSLEGMYERAAKLPSDINEHVPKLRELAAQSKTVVEFGMRPAVSTVAILAGQPERFITYGARADPISKVLDQWRGKTAFEFRQGDSLSVEIEEADLLFLDTRHTADHLWQELNRHAPKVRRIALHDTSVFGERGEDGGPGLLAAVRRWVHEHREWTVTYRVENNHGLTVLSRDEQDKQQPPGKLRQALNFTKALAAHAKAGMKLADDETYTRRLDTCLECPKRFFDQCGLCGCPVDKKASWASEQCPDTPPRWLALTVVAESKLG